MRLGFITISFFLWTLVAFAQNQKPEENQLGTKLSEKQRKERIKEAIQFLRIREDEFFKQFKTKIRAEMNQILNQTQGGLQTREQFSRFTVLQDLEDEIQNKRQADYRELYQVGLNTSYRKYSEVGEQFVQLARERFIPRLSRLLAMVRYFESVSEEERSKDKAFFDSHQAQMQALAHDLRKELETVVVMSYFAHAGNSWVIEKLSELSGWTAKLGAALTLLTTLLQTKVHLFGNEIPLAPALLGGFAALTGIIAIINQITQNYSLGQTHSGELLRVFWNEVLTSLPAFTEKTPDTQSYLGRVSNSIESLGFPGMPEWALQCKSYLEGNI